MEKPVYKDNEYSGDHDYYKKYDRPLKKRQKKMMSYIVNYAKENDGAVPTYNRIAKDMKMSSTALVSKDMIQLEHHGYIERYTIPGGGRFNRRYRILTDKNIDELEDPFEEDGIESYKNAKIPYIYRIKNPEDILSKENYNAYISVPIETGKQKFTYSFRCPHSKFKKDGMFFKSIVVFDIKKKYIHMDYVAYYNEKTKRLDIKKYDRNESDEEKAKIVGKIVGAYTEITY